MSPGSKRRAERLSRPITVQDLVRRHRISQAEARLIVEAVPLRGTDAWDRREQAREKCRCWCLSW